MVLHEQQQLKQEVPAGVNAHWNLQDLQQGIGHQVQAEQLRLPAQLRREARRTRKEEIRLNIPQISLWGSCWRRNPFLALEVSSTCAHAAARPPRRPAGWQLQRVLLLHILNLTCCCPLPPGGLQVPHASRMQAAVCWPFGAQVRRAPLSRCRRTSVERMQGSRKPTMGLHACMFKGVHALIQCAKRSSERPRKWPRSTRSLAISFAPLATVPVTFACWVCCRRQNSLHPHNSACKLLLRLPVAAQGAVILACARVGVFSPPICFLPKWRLVFSASWPLSEVGFIPVEPRSSCQCKRLGPLSMSMLQFLPCSCVGFHSPQQFVAAGPPTRYALSKARFVAPFAIAPLCCGVQEGIVQELIHN